MMRTVRRSLIDEWVHDNGPDGVSRLALKSGVSASFVSKIRVGRVPVKPITRRAMAKAIGVGEDELFPFVDDDREQAS